MESKFVLGLVASAVLLAGCGSSSTDTTGKPKPKLDAILHNTVVDECTVATEGVKICVDGRPEIPCAPLTDNLGIADLAIPKNEELLISYSKDGFIPKLREYVSDQDVNPGLGTWFLQRQAWYDAAAKSIGGASASFDYKLGLIGLQTDPIPGLTANLEPLEGQPKSYLPFQFQVVTGTGCPGPEPCASGTTCDVATVGYANVPLGKWKAYFTAPTGTNMTCTTDGFACKDGTPGCKEIESRAGYNNFGFIHCVVQ